MENYIDRAVKDAMRAYLKTSSSGGMPRDQVELVRSCVDDAARLNYFAVAVAVAEAHTRDVENDHLRAENERLRAAIIQAIPGSCTCMVMSSILDHHQDRCRYRILATVLAEKEGE